MVRKIKAYNQTKVKVTLDGRTHRMYFKTALKAIKKSHKSYFTEEGHVILESKHYADAGQIAEIIERKATSPTEQESRSDSDGIDADQPTVGESEREPVHPEQTHGQAEVR